MYVDTDFWGITRIVSLKWTDVSEVRTASIITFLMEAVRISETPVYFKKTTPRYLPEDSHLQF
jgi:hypothetical protein